MNVGASVRKKCEHCQVIRRKNGKGKSIVRVICERNKRHKQRQG